MPVKNSKSSRSSSRSPRRPKHAAWPILWVRLINGDEYVTPAKVMRDGIIMVEPTMITSIQGFMVLAPYGLMSKEPSFFLPNQSVLHANEVIDSVATLYRASIKNHGRFVADNFEKVVSASTKQVASHDLNDVPEPTEDDIMKALAGAFPDADVQIMKVTDPEQVAAIESVTKRRSRTEAVDNLAKLAEAAGKGKKKAGEA